MKIKSKLIKSSYVSDYSTNNIDLYVLIVQIIFLMFVIVNDKIISGSRIFTISMLLFMYLNAYIYVYIKYKLTLLKINSEQLELGDETANWIKKFKFGLILYYLITFFIIVTFLFIRDKEYIINNYSNYLWIWFSPQMLLMYMESYYWASIIAFGKNYYISRQYKISYCDITRINIIKKAMTQLGEIYVVEIYKDNKLIGFDKLFINEYIRLRKLTYENQYEKSKRKE